MTIVDGIPGGRERRSRTIVRVWPDEPAIRQVVSVPRDDIVLERADGNDRFVQVTGPFRSYERQVEYRDHSIVERTSYRLVIPWFGWVFALAVRWHLARRGVDAVRADHSVTPWWAPPDRITSRHALILGLLAGASMSSAFTNTLFTQTAQFAADDFGVSDTGFGNAGAIVRAGIVFALPFAVVADRIGRQRVMRVVAWAAPIVCALGAFAPSFGVLVATQTVGRPLGLALDFLIAVVVAEEMPRNSRAYAVSVMAMASGLGAGIAVMALPLADLGDSGWRMVYLVTLIWLAVAVDIVRRLPETRRFTLTHRIAPPLDRRRLALMGMVAIGVNIFVAPASFFQNRYLADIRGFDASGVAIFTLATATPAGVGLIMGGRLADLRGRRMLIAVALPTATTLVLTSFLVGGFPMWLAAFGGGLISGLSVPALAVYRAELFPTGNRSRAAGLLTAFALFGGIVGLQIVGRLLDRGLSYGNVIGLVALGPIMSVILVMATFPETAHRELEDLNPEDDPIAPATIATPPGEPA